MERRGKSRARLLEADSDALCGQIIFQKDGYNMARRSPVADGLEKQLEVLTRHGYRVVSVSQLLALCPFSDLAPQDAQFAAAKALLDAGALDVYTVPVGMKKSRPGTLLCVLCRVQDREKILRALFKHTTTLGVRETPLRRYTMTRRVETVQTGLGAVRCKVSEGYGVVRRKFEYDDLARLAREQNRSLQEITEQIEK